MADSKLTALTANTTPASADILYIVDDPGGSPLSQKITWGNLLGSNLTAIYGLTSAADKGIYFTGSGTAAVFDLSTFARTILDDANAAAVRTTIGAAASGANSDITSITALSTPLTSAQGGTGVNNAGTITNATNTTITGGGTLALAGFTLTVPATGTAALLATNNTFTGYQTISTGGGLTPLGLVATNSTTSSVLLSLQINNTIGGTPAAGFGQSVAFTLKSSTTYGQTVVRLVNQWETATHASRVPDSIFYMTDYGGEREIWRGRANGTAAAIGFLGATPVVRASAIADPTGGATVDAESRTAINAIIVVLENLGFIAT